MPSPPYGVFPPTTPPTIGYGGLGYGHGRYGSGSAPREPYPVTGGYGGQQYGYNPYGSIDTTPPRVSSALSLDGFRVELFFSEEMRNNAAFTDPANYTFATTIGAPLTTVSVTPGTPGTFGGYTSVIITHTGSTLGGDYIVTASGIEDLAGNPILPAPASSAQFLALGDTAQVEITPTSADTIEFQYKTSAGATQDMLTEAEFSPGITDASNYSYTTTYPIPIVVSNYQHPFGGDASKVQADVENMTSASYDAVVGPSLAFDYVGDVLPSADPNFNGVEFGTGSSTASAGTGLLLTKSNPNIYGWFFEDTSGRVLPASSHRVDFTFDASAAIYSPPLYNTALGTLSFSDGAVQINVTLNRVGGTDVLDVTSGAFSAQVPAAWSSAPMTISVLRNQKADSYAVLVNGTPLVSALTATFGGPITISPGASFLLAATYTVTQFKITEVKITSSQTIFTTAWNFLHQISAPFTGSPAGANDRILTKRGPLTKGWGDATPATKQDVEVRINGTPVAVKGVNPYTGTIFPEVPIPLTTPGTVSVEVDYKWFPAPVMPLVALNTPGLVLNKWDQPRGHTAGAVSPSPPGHEGVVDPSRFPMAVGLMPPTRPQPIEIGHRYIGFERDYSALLNSPTTLLLNMDPHRVSRPYLETDCVEFATTFDGTTTPQLAEDPWSLNGTDSGGVVGDGTYRVIDASAGSYATGEAALYYRVESLDCDSTIRLGARLQVEEWVADGVFTGVGFGFHDNYRLYLVGLLEVNGLRHIGMLLNEETPHLQDSWRIGPSATGTIVDENTITFDVDDFPQNIDTGSQFQILDGSQTGVYTIATCGIDIYQGTVTVTIEEEFPADPDLYGNDTAIVYFETPWDEELTTFRVEARVAEDDADRSATVYIGGSLSGEAVVLEGTELASIPAGTSLFIQEGEESRFLWGSVSRIATNSTIWSFDRYSSTPDAVIESLRGLVVAAEMSDPPEEDSNHEWWKWGGFGYSLIDSSGDTLLLKSTSGSSNIDLTYGYGRFEPVFNRRVFCDCDAEFQIDSGILGAGDATVRVADDLREVRLTNILYREGFVTGDYRRLASMASISLSGLMTPAEQGWVASTSSGMPTASAQNQWVTITKANGEEGWWRSALTLGDDDSGGRIFEARLAVTSYTAGAGGEVGPMWGANVGSGALTYHLRATLKDGPARVVLTDGTGTEHGSFAFDWTDGEFHTYRVLADPTVGTAVLVVDDVVQGSVLLTAFASSLNDRFVRMGVMETDGASVSVWDSFNVTTLPVSSVKRTLGVYTGLPGTGVDDINSYKLPRTDGTDEPNSTVSAVIEEWDWTSLLRVRVHLDQTWGVSIYRPDLPPPPWFTGDFATQITDPTAAWINVEYPRIPLAQDMKSSVMFGSLDSRSITQQRWKQVRYRLYNTPTEDYIQPQGMVLNRYNVIHSGEFNVDITPEVVTVTSLTSTTVSIRSAHMNADRIFNVVVDGSVVPSTTWTFDEDTQIITFSSALPSEQYPVTVTFAPAKPVTETYVCSQPFEASVTKLNEDTPPYPMSQTATATSQVVFGSKLNDPSDVLGDPDFILNDPYRTVEWSDPEGAEYDCLKFCEVDNGGERGMLSIACDGPAPENGLIGLELDGTMGAYWDVFSVPGGPAGPWGNGSPVIGGTQAQFDQLNPGIMHWSGGNLNTDGTWGPGTSVWYPNYPGEGQQGNYDSPAAQQGMGLNQEVLFALVVATPYEDVWDVPSVWDDNVPPSSPDPTTDPNPDGTPGLQNHGACAARLVDYAGPAAADRWGPWGGLDSLQQSLWGGGAPLTGDEFTWNGGAVVPGPTTTDFQIEAAN